MNTRQPTVASMVTERRTLNKQIYEMETLLLLLAENANDIISYLTPMGFVAYVSPSVQTLLGYEPNELCGRTATQWIHVEDRGQAIDFGRAIYQGNYERPFMTRIRHKDGRYIWFETTLKAALDDNCNILGMLGISRDVSERRAIQERLEHAQRMAGLGNWERNFKTGDVYWSPEIYRMAGLDVKEPVTEQRILDLIHPQDRPHVSNGFKSAEAGGLYNMEYRIVRTDGEIRYIHSQGEPIYQGGEIVGMFGSLQDVTKYRRIEEDLRRSKDNLKLAQRMARFGHWDYDCVTNEFYCSRALLEIWGLDEADEGQAIPLITESILPEDRHHILSLIHGTVEGDSLDVELRIQQPDGTTRLIHALAQATLNEWGEVMRWFGTVQDVTDRKQTEELLARSETLSAVGQLAAGLAHEIRNPLTSLKGFTQLMYAREENRRYCDIMTSELTRIESIVNELLVLAKPQAIRVEPNSIDTILDEVVILFESEAVLHGVLLVREREQTDLTANVVCEANQIKQVFINLAKNAIEAMPSGGTLRISSKRQGEHVIITFADKGLGIPPEVLRQLGEPFVTTKPNGMGLGMMVCKKILQDHNGTMTVTSEVGMGTQVAVRLPIQN